jgi:hypothetical protein
MAHATYSPKDVIIALSGTPITGFAEDDFLTLSRTSPLLDPIVGADGELTRTKNADETGTIVISLAQTARANLTLSAFAALQRAAPDLPLGILEIKDPSGSVLAIGTNVVLAKLPEVTLGATASNSKDWEFHCEKLEYTVVPEGVDFPVPRIENGRIVV